MLKRDTLSQSQEPTPIKVPQQGLATSASASSLDHPCFSQASRSLAPSFSDQSQGQRAGNSSGGDEDEGVAAVAREAERALEGGTNSSSAPHKRKSSSVLFSWMKQSYGRDRISSLGSGGSKPSSASVSRKSSSASGTPCNASNASSPNYSYARTISSSTAASSGPPSSHVSPRLSGSLGLASLPPSSLTPSTGASKVKNGQKRKKRRRRLLAVQPLEKLLPRNSQEQDRDSHNSAGGFRGSDRDLLKPSDGSASPGNSGSWYMDTATMATMSLAAAVDQSEKWEVTRNSGYHNASPFADKAFTSLVSSPASVPVSLAAGADAVSTSGRASMFPEPGEVSKEASSLSEALMLGAMTSGSLHHDRSLVTHGEASSVSPNSRLGSHRWNQSPSTAPGSSHSRSPSRFGIPTPEAVDKPARRRKKLGIRLNIFRMPPPPRLRLSRRRRSSTKLPSSASTVSATTRSASTTTPTSQQSTAAMAPPYDATPDPSSVFLRPSVEDIDSGGDSGGSRDPSPAVTAFHSLPNSPASRTTSACNPAVKAGSTRVEQQLSSCNGQEVKDPEKSRDLLSIEAEEEAKKTTELLLMAISTFEREEEDPFASLDFEDLVSSPAPGAGENGGTLTKTESKAGQDFKRRLEVPQSSGHLSMDDEASPPPSSSSSSSSCSSTETSPSEPEPTLRGGKFKESGLGFALKLPGKRQAHSDEDSPQALVTAAAKAISKAPEERFAIQFLDSDDESDDELVEEAQEPTDSQAAGGHGLKLGAAPSLNGSVTVAGGGNRAGHGRGLALGLGRLSLKDIDPTSSFSVSETGTFKAAGFAINQGGVAQNGERKGSCRSRDGSTFPTPSSNGSPNQFLQDSPSLSVGSIMSSSSTASGRSLSIESMTSQRSPSLQTGGLGPSATSSGHSSMVTDSHSLNKFLSKDTLLLLREIGDGQNGRVVKALHTPSLSMMALKRINIYEKVCFFVPARVTSPLPSSLFLSFLVFSSLLFDHLNTIIILFFSPSPFLALILVHEI